MPSQQKGSDNLTSFQQFEGHLTINHVQVNTALFSQGIPSFPLHCRTLSMFKHLERSPH